MRLFSLIISTIFIASTALSDEIEDPYFLEPIQSHSDHVMPEPQIDPISYVYFKAGTSIWLQGLGVGKRTSNFETQRGNDWAFNVKMPLLFSRKQAFTSIEYTRLFYKPFLPDTDYHKYSGVGLEIGVLLGETYHPIPIPNPKLVWGKEYSQGQFSQWSLNLLPTALFAYTVGASLAHPYHHDCGFTYAAGIVSLGVMVEYSLSF